MRAVVLTYHSNNVHGNEHASNDHVALAEDLRRLAALRLPVVPLHAVVDALDGAVPLPERCVALSFDDGSAFDWHDLPHPAHGMQRSFGNVLADAVALHPGLHATAFVIVSPEARATLDRTCLVGRGWWGEEWWDAALASGLLAIESHSWDHQHETLAATASGLQGGRFDNIATRQQADAEIAAASRYLDQRLPQRRTRLFAYPYGEYNDYLVEDYLPRQRAAHGLDAAFTTRPVPVEPAGDRWALGRYVCGRDWRSSDDLARLLADAFA